VSEPKRGVPLVCEAVTAAASLLAILKRHTGPLDDRDRRNCEAIQRQLEAAETVLYGHACGDGPLTPPSRLPS
jgi:hypothetical protein